MFLVNASVCLLDGKAIQSPWYPEPFDRSNGRYERGAPGGIQHDSLDGDVATGAVATC